MPDLKLVNKFVRDPLDDRQNCIQSCAQYLTNQDDSRVNISHFAACAIIGPLIPLP